ncbi:MAG: hypothetical protein L6R42_003159 [Xanthoria sp. 1 TBL-2021]|nr:MAG: hypothetical protein L6R42_003159 [Xanthoria sp. 1 TBL-2021]
MSSMLSQRSVLVVGGCGFLGHHIVSQLLDKNARVSVLDFKLDRNRFDAVDYHSANIAVKSEVERVVNTVHPQVIIHTASPTALASNSALYYAVNVDGTRNLLECARDIKTVKAFVYTSSASVVHDSVSNLVNADESFPLLFLPVQREVYSHTKALADDLVRDFNSPKQGLLTVCLRPAGIFGEGDTNTLQKMIENAQSGKNKYQVGSGKNLFDWTYVANAASAHILASEALLTAASSAKTIGPQVAGEAFFITNGDPMPFWDFVRAIGEAAGYPVRKKDVWVIPKGLGLAMALIAEWFVWLLSFGKQTSTMNRAGIRYSCLTRTYTIEKARTRLGYNPKVDMKEGIRRGVDWWLSDKKKKTQ